MLSGATPHFARTPASSYVEVAPPVPQHDPLVDARSWAMSLSGRADHDPFDARIGGER